MASKDDEAPKVMAVQSICEINKINISQEWYRSSLPHHWSRPICYINSEEIFQIYLSGIFLELSGITALIIKALNPESLYFLPFIWSRKLQLFTLYSQFAGRCMNELDATKELNKWNWIRAEPTSYWQVKSGTSREYKNQQDRDLGAKNLLCPP